MIKTAVPYSFDNVAAEGALVTEWPNSRRPLVLVAHTGLGITDFELQCADALAQKGYASFVADLYGSAVEPRSPRRAMEESSMLLARRTELRARMRAAMRVAITFPCVDADRIAVMGYDLGGTGALELARAGEDLRAVISLYGTLSAPHGPSPQRVEAKVLTLLGADDPFIEAPEIALFEDEMRRLAVDYFLVRFGGAVHGFAEPGRGTAPQAGIAFDATAAKRAWRIILEFLDETTAPGTV